MFEDEEVGAVLAGKSDHILVVVLDPSADYFAVGQFEAHRFLLFAERLQVRGFLESLVRVLSTLLANIGISRLERHRGILHGDRKWKEIESRLRDEFDSR
jgi:hypothetical protein